ncbi:MAG: LolA family protein [Candidatus Sulfotelmatobacter sp.]
MARARIRLGCAVLALLIFPGVLAAQEHTLQDHDLQAPDLQNNALLNRIWDGVQQAQKKYTSNCGTITETRTSSLMARPLVLHGKFCAEGMTRFALEYSEPSKVRIRFNQDYLNVTVGDKTEVLEVGSNVRRTQSYFSRENSIGNLQKNFIITVQEDSGDYTMKLVPRTDAFRRRLNYLVVKLDKRDFLLRSLEVDGKSGVNSVFVIDVNSLNPKIPPETFEVYKPK